MSFAGRLAEYQTRVDNTLDEWLPADSRNPTRLHQAMRYAVMAGGKRVRPLLVYATGEVLDVPADRLDAPAAAVEMIHTYSLIHDDLPAMDDDDLRRGRATCHKAFDEATAILAGDALQAMAFQILATDRHMLADPARRLQMIDLATRASGASGMVGGQAMDLAATGHAIDAAQLEAMHIHKTGALIHASVALAYLSHPGLRAREQESLDHYARCIGLAFQIQDDILDVEGETSVLGKVSGADSARDKPTYPSVLGMAESKALALELHRDAIGSLELFGEAAAPLRWLSEYVVTRGS
jgi:farnesyl diphosphate synthase